MHRSPTLYCRHSGASPEGILRLAPLGLIRRWFLLLTCILFLAAATSAGATEADGPPVTLQSAVASAVQQNFGIRVEKLSVDAGQGRLTAASGEFDWNLVSQLSATRERQPDLFPYYIGTDYRQWDYSAGVEKKLRNGVVISPNIGAGILNDRDETLGHWISQGAVNFEIMLPLARGGGEVSADAGENFARKDLDSTYAGYRHQVASSVLDVISAYWTCVGAAETLDILRAWEKQAEDMEAKVTSLSHAKLFSMAYVEQAQSYSREKKTRRVNAELDEYKARQALGVAMGISGENLVSPPMPAEKFPQLNAPDLPEATQYNEVIRFALDHRQDVKAAQSTQEALAILSQAARHDLRPRVDLSLRLSYDGIDHGRRPQSFLTNSHDGLTVMGGLSMDFPVENRVQSGQLKERLALENQASLAREQLSQTVASDVMVALQEVARTFEAYTVSLDAEKYYAQAVDKERKRFLLGDSNFVDVITIEDKFRDAQLETISARQAHLIALAKLRYATGTLVGGEAAQGSISVNSLTSVPKFR